MEGKQNFSADKAIETVESIKSKFTPEKNPYQVHKNTLSPLDKFAIVVTNIVGTMGFFFFCCVLVIIPLIVTSTLPVVQYISSGIFLPLIMVGQNLQGRYTEIRAQHDFDTNVKAEKEIETILLHLEKQDEMMLGILHKIEKLEKQK